MRIIGGRSWSASSMTSRASRPRPDLGSRVNRSQRLLALNSMSYAVARAVLSRAGHEVGGDSYLHAANEPGGVRLERRRVPVVERPPYRGSP